MWRDLRVESGRVLARPASCSGREARACRFRRARGAAGALRKEDQGHGSRPSGGGAGLRFDRPMHRGPAVRLRVWLVSAGSTGTSGSWSETREPDAPRGLGRRLVHPGAQAQPGAGVDDGSRRVCGSIDERSRSTRAGAGEYRANRDRPPRKGRARCRRFRLLDPIGIGRQVPPGDRPPGRGVVAVWPIRPKRTASEARSELGFPAASERCGPDVEARLAVSCGRTEEPSTGGERGREAFGPTASAASQRSNSGEHRTSQAAAGERRQAGRQASGPGGESRGRPEVPDGGRQRHRSGRLSSRRPRGRPGPEASGGGGEASQA